MYWADTVIAGETREPFLHIRKQADRYVSSGQASCSVGHRIHRARRADDGVFASWNWDGHTLKIENDRYGLYPLYYAVWDGQIAVSPGITSLLDCGPPADLDEEALAVFLRLGFFLAEDTPFRAIRVVPPGAVFQWSAGVLKLESGFTLPKPQSIGRIAAQDGLIELLAESIRRRCPPSEDFAVPLSGGRDSRHILLRLCAQGLKPRFCLTVRDFVRRQHDEDEIAAQVAAAVGVPHIVIHQATDRLTAERRKNITTDFCTDEHTWLLALADHLPGKARWVYDGIGGDVLGNGLFAESVSIELYEANRVDELADRLLGSEIWPSILTAQARTRLSRSVALGRLIREMQRHTSAPSTINSFYFWNRTRREIGLAPCRILARVVEAYCPYLDHDLFDLLAALPARMFADRSFHTEAIARAFPRYASIGYFDKRTAGHTRLDRAVNWKFALALLRTGLVASRTQLLRRGYWVPRMVRGLVDPSPSGLLAIDWLGPVVVYFQQLSSLTEHGDRRNLG